MKAYWYKGNWTDETYNIGDGVVPFILKYLTGKDIISCNNKDSGKLLSCGSVIEFIEDNDTVWGSGLIQSMPLIKKNNVKFLMVRGPLTRSSLLEVGYTVPEIYGDPCTLLPEILHGHCNKEYPVGIIPHYTETNEMRIMYPDSHYINIISNIETFVKEICKCEKIVTSSLHGYIISNAYNIPVEYKQLTEKIIGGMFKFNDYCEGKIYKSDVKEICSKAIITLIEKKI